MSEKSPLLNAFGPTDEKRREIVPIHPGRTAQFSTGRIIHKRIFLKPGAPATTPNAASPRTLSLAKDYDGEFVSQRVKA
ncbi:MAG: hypothetical protein Q7T46_03670 [Polaromonas sp.]|nr:hypothetical protein [Polaromonas sp.]